MPDSPPNRNRPNAVLRFKALGAFFCNFATPGPPPFLSVGARGQMRARIPDLVASRLPRPYHFRARIQSFQVVAAPFPGDSVLPSGSLAPRCRTETLRRSTISLGDIA